MKKDNTLQDIVGCKLNVAKEVLLEKAKNHYNNFINSLPQEILDAPIFLLKDAEEGECNKLMDNINDMKKKESMIIQLGGESIILQDDTDGLGDDTAELYRAIKAKFEKKNKKEN
ncbi:hypothetical protein SLOPH_734 [Spraguea lophii 42_110]|uniref:Uncharacterized protein n=1 Tax=Spraguea lophii (strain 42_110) TaxID=1358809 RepID=S7W4Q6_SPRLO|nr:hypothetical protein SLOPH_734 [Spraguea lophii 42_110]